MQGAYPVCAIYRCAEPAAAGPPLEMRAELCLTAALLLACFASGCARFRVFDAASTGVHVLFNACPTLGPPCQLGLEQRACASVLHQA